MIISNSKIISFVASDHGSWNIMSMKTISGNALPLANRINVVREPFNGEPHGFQWVQQGFISNLRYTTRDEKTSLDAGSKPLGEPGHHAAAFIPIKKSDTWWTLTQDERRKVFEEDSQHIARSMKYLPFISRQLHHSRDLGGEFDFLTWFEFSSDHMAEFDELCYTLRNTREWEFVVREVEIKLRKNDFNSRLM